MAVNVDVYVVTVDRQVATNVSSTEDLSQELGEADEGSSLVVVPNGSNQPLTIQIAPNLSNATASADGTDGYSGSFDTDDADGTAYTVVTTSSTTPDAQEVKNGNNHNGSTAAASESQAISSAGTKSIGQTGVLSSGTQHYGYTMHEDGNGNQSEVISHGSFTTATATPARTKVIGFYA